MLAYFFDTFYVAAFYEHWKDFLLSKQFEIKSMQTKKKLWAYANYFVNIYPQNKRIERG